MSHDLNQPDAVPPVLTEEGNLHTLVTPVEQQCTSCAGKGTVLAYDGSRLRAAREGVGVSLRTMAKTIGISAAYLSDLERGHRGISEKIAVAFREEVRKQESLTVKAKVEK